jgi:hypothetical protein
MWKKDKYGFSVKIPWAFFESSSPILSMIKRLGASSTAVGGTKQRGLGTSMR